MMMHVFPENIHSISFELSTLLWELGGAGGRWRWEFWPFLTLNSVKIGPDHISNSVEKLSTTKISLKNGINYFLEKICNWKNERIFKLCMYQMTFYVAPHEEFFLISKWCMKQRLIKAWKITRLKHVASVQFQFEIVFKGILRDTFTRTVVDLKNVAGKVWSSSQIFLHFRIFSGQLKQLRKSEITNFSC